MEPDKNFFIAAFRREVQAFSEAARLHPGQIAPAIPSCPGWTMNDLVLHLGSVHRRVTRLLTQPTPETSKFNPQDLSFLELKPSYLNWLVPGPAPLNIPLEAAIIKWFEDGAKNLTAIFEATDPAQPCISWGAEQTARHWFRAQAMEAALHRWDAQHAHQVAQPIEPELAADGCDLTLFALPVRLHDRPISEATGQTYHFHRTDGPGEWLVRFDPATIKVSREHSKGDIALRGTASDLLLFLWRRQATTPLEIFGNAELLDLYFQMAPQA